MTEPAVTLTDLALALLAAVFAWRLARGTPAGLLRRWLVVFFASIAAATLLGGAVHGFFADPAGAGARILWPLALLAVGVTGLAGWALGARMLLGPRAARAVTVGAGVLFVLYAAALAGLGAAFELALVQYLPPTLFLLAATGLAWRRRRETPLLHAALGLITLLVASWVQWRRIALHPAYFDHNALYHVIAAGGLVLIYRGARRLAGDPAPGR